MPATTPCRVCPPVTSNVTSGAELTVSHVPQEPTGGTEDPSLPTITTVLKHTSAWLAQLLLGDVRFAAVLRILLLLKQLSSNFSPDITRISTLSSGNCRI